MAKKQSKKKVKKQTKSAKEAKPKKVGRLEATVHYFKDLKKAVTVAQAIKDTNRIHLNSGGTDNPTEQKFSVVRTITTFEILGLVKREEDGTVCPVKRR